MASQLGAKIPGSKKFEEKKFKLAAQGPRHTTFYSNMDVENMQEVSL